MNNFKMISNKKTTTKSVHHRIRFWMLLLLLMSLICYFAIHQWSDIKQSDNLNLNVKANKKASNYPSADNNEKIYFKGVNLSELKMVGSLISSKNKFVFIRFNNDFKKTKNWGLTF